MRHKDKKYFCVDVSAYVADKRFHVYRPSSLNAPLDHSVMFISEGFMDLAASVERVENCLVFWPENHGVSAAIREKHAVVLCREPHNAFCRFFKDNRIQNLPIVEDGRQVNGTFIAEKAVIGERAAIFPGSYIGGDVTIGNDVYVGSGARIVGEVTIGNNVIIRENTVIGADGLTTDRDELGRAITMPQFGGIIIEDNVEIGANTVIARGAIDHTIIRSGAKIDNSTFISHNAVIGRDTFIVGETILFGSASTGERALISGNAAICNGVHIGDDAVVGMGSVVIRSVHDGTIVKGNPAK